jgi:predicted small secreted protein
MTKLPKILLASLALVSLVVFTGCNTVNGIGEDFEAMGESMQKAGE